MIFFVFVVFSSLIGLYVVSFMYRMHLIGTGELPWWEYYNEAYSSTIDAIFYVIIFQAVMLTTIVFLGKFTKNAVNLDKPINQNYTLHSRLDLACKISLALFLCLFVVLANKVGGIFAVLSSGYYVTEMFSATPLMGMVIDWMVAITFFALSSRMSAGRSPWFWLILQILMIAMLSYLGRRSSLSIIFLSYIFLAYAFFGLAKIKKIIIPGFIAVLFLNVIGFVRQFAADDLLSFFQTSAALIEKLYYDGDLVNMLFYTFQTGAFAIPFESLPLMMDTHDCLSQCFIGSSYVNSLGTLIPSVILDERPDNLARWYMLNYYDSGADIREGRQFFFLTEAYLNWGWLGAPLTGIFFGFSYTLLYRIYRIKSFIMGNFLLFCQTMVFGTMLYSIANELGGYLVVFFKGFLFPALLCVLIYLILNMFSRSGRVD